MTYEEGGYGIFSIKYFYEKIFIRGIFSAYFSMDTEKDLCFHLASCEKGDPDSGKFKEGNISGVSWCFICKESGGHISHLLIYCWIVSWLW